MRCSIENVKLALVATFVLPLSVRASDGSDGGSAGDGGASLATAAAVSTVYAGSSDTSAGSRAKDDHYDRGFTPGGTGLVLDGHLGTGATSIDFATLGSLLAAAAAGEKLPGFSDEDHARAIAVTLHNVAMFDHADDPRLGVLFHALQPLRDELEFGSLLTNPHLRWKFRDFYVALRLIEAHAGIGSAEERTSLDQIGGGVGYRLLRSILYHRDIMKDYPRDAELVGVLELVRERLGPGARGAWRALVEKMRVELPTSLDYELQRQLVGPEMRAAGITAGATFVTYSAAMMTHAALVTASGYAAFALQGMIAVPVFAAGAALGVMTLRRGPRLAKARGRLDQFIRACETALIEEPH